jgi:carotenoid cleavage dioxygenase-like enzyme
MSDIYIISESNLMNEITEPLNQTVPSGCPQLPESIMTASRCEHTNLNLEIEGQLPEDLQGHVFIVAPVGTVNSGGLPFPNGDSFLNGDGMIYRLDFDVPGEVTITTRLVKPPDYYADKATQPGSSYEKYQFRNHGISRFSWKLGLRNELNTAFLPMRWREDAIERLLVTYDTGRPYEIDTETLEVVTPIGSNQEWQAEINKPTFPFKPILSTAHPVFDAYKGEMFTVNYGRSMLNFLETLPILFELEELPDEFYQLIATIMGVFNADILRDMLRESFQLMQYFLEKTTSLLEQLIGLDIEDFVYLIRWDGKGNLERWKLQLPDGSPVRIEQTMHQIGLSEDYVILMDTSFITGIEQILNNPFPENKATEELLRELLESPNQPDSSIYIVRRSDLKAGQKPACSDREVIVLAKKMVIPLAAAHFLVDYNNPNGQVTLNIAHICAWDIAEWVRQYDVSAYPPHHPIAKRVYSMESSEMDISRLGRYVIDGERGDIIQSKVIHASPYTWGMGMYTYPNQLCLDKKPTPLDNIYWNSFGLWEEIMTKFLFELYQDYKYRVVPVKDLLDLAKQGVPSCLFRLHTTEDSMTIADSYPFPDGYIGCSPQFIPCRGSQEDSLQGYIVCLAFTPEKSEFWIFDAANLAGKPLCKMSHSDLNMGYSLHTAWLPKIGRRQASYNIPVKTDYEQLVNQKSPEIQKLFEQEIYPHF